MDIAEKLADLLGHDVKDDPNHPIVEEGDKVKIVDYSFTTPNEAVKLSMIDYHLVTGVDKHPIGDNGNYHWEYAVWIEGEHSRLVCPDEYDRNNIIKKK